MAKFVKKNDFTDKEKQQISDMTGKIMLWILNGRSIAYMAEQLRLTEQELIYNIEENLYELRKLIGSKRYLKMLFVRRRRKRAPNKGSSF